MESTGSTLCPVCTLYLRPGITLQSHLETHPKDKVIEALVRQQYVLPAVFNAQQVLCQPYVYHHQQQQQQQVIVAATTSTSSQQQQQQAQIIPVIMSSSTVSSFLAAASPSIAAAIQQNGEILDGSGPDNSQMNQTGMIPSNSTMLAHSNSQLMNPNPASQMLNPANSTMVSPSNSQMVSPSNSHLVNPLNSHLVNSPNTQLVNPPNAQLLNPPNSALLSPLNMLSPNGQMIVPSNSAMMSSNSGLLNQPTLVYSNSAMLDPSNSMFGSSNSSNGAFDNGNPPNSPMNLMSSNSASQTVTSNASMLGSSSNALLNQNSSNSTILRQPPSNPAIISSNSAMLCQPNMISSNAPMMDPTNSLMLVPSNHNANTPSSSISPNTYTNSSPSNSTMVTSNSLLVAHGNPPNPTMINSSTNPLIVAPLNSANQTMDNSTMSNPLPQPQIFQPPYNTFITSTPNGAVFIYRSNVEESYVEETEELNKSCQTSGNDNGEETSPAKSRREDAGTKKGGEKMKGEEEAESEETEIFEWCEDEEAEKEDTARRSEDEEEKGFAQPSEENRYKGEERIREDECLKEPDDFSSENFDCMENPEEGENGEQSQDGEIVDSKVEYEETKILCEQLVTIEQEQVIATTKREERRNRKNTPRNAKNNVMDEEIDLTQSPRQHGDDENTRISFDVIILSGEEGDEAESQVSTRIQSLRKKQNEEKHKKVSVRRKSQQSLKEVGIVVLAANKNQQQQTGNQSNRQLTPPAEDHVYTHRSRRRPSGDQEPMKMSRKKYRRRRRLQDEETDDDTEDEEEDYVAAEQSTTTRVLRNGKCVISKSWISWRRNPDIENQLSIQIEEIEDPPLKSGGNEEADQASSSSGSYRLLQTEEIEDQAISSTRDLQQQLMENEAINVQDILIFSNGNEGVDKNKQEPNKLDQNEAIDGNGFIDIIEKSDESETEAQDEINTTKINDSVQKDQFANDLYEENETEAGFGGELLHDEQIKNRFENDARNVLLENQIEPGASNEAPERSDLLQIESSNLEIAYLQSDEVIEYGSERAMFVKRDEAVVKDEPQYLTLTSARHSPAQLTQPRRQSDARALDMDGMNLMVNSECFALNEYAIGGEESVSVDGANIRADENMPARGELSGQESSNASDLVVALRSGCDLLARESWDEDDEEDYEGFQNNFNEDPGLNYGCFNRFKQDSENLGTSFVSEAGEAVFRMEKMMSFTSSSLHEPAASSSSNNKHLIGGTSNFTANTSFSSEPVEIFNANDKRFIPEKTSNFASTSSQQVEIFTASSITKRVRIFEADKVSLQDNQPVEIFTDPSINKRVEIFKAENFASAASSSLNDQRVEIFDTASAKQIEGYKEEKALTINNQSAEVFNTPTEPVNVFKTEKTSTFASTTSSSVRNKTISVVNKVEEGGFFGGNKIVCTMCSCLVDSVASLKQHSEEVHGLKGDEKYKCAVCGEAFQTEPKFTQHLQVHPLECRLCGKYFYRRQNMQLHLKRHMNIRPYKCTACDKSFLTKQKLDEHRNVHTGATPIKCTLCDETFRRHSNLVQHRNRHHLDVKRKVKDFVCACGEVFHSKKKLAWHRETHEEKPKACGMCSEKFVHAASLTRHMRKAHNEKFVPDAGRDKENVECPICKNVYLRSSLDVHMKTHTGARPFACSICNKEFTTKWNLKLHKWTHAARVTKPYKCDKCKGAFVRASDYAAHMNAHRSVRPYTCNHCGAQFIRKYNCLRHVREHERTKTHACQVCGKEFHRSYYLKDHMRVHSGARPYACHICGKTSATKSNHNKHVRIHHARDPVSTEN